MGSYPKSELQTFNSYNYCIYSSTTNDYVRSGQNAEVKCMVIYPTDKLDFAWYNNTDIIEGINIMNRGFACLQYAY